MSTKTATAEKIETEAPIAQVAESRGEVAIFQPPRLPWHDAINTRFPNIDKSSWKALVEAIYPAAKSIDSVIMALAYCKARNLDVFKRVVHIVPMWDTKSGGYIETVWPGISELRTTAFRTGQYAGCDETEFGPVIEKSFTGEMWENKKKVEKTITVKFHEWARITIYRVVHGASCKFVGPKVLWLEAYASVGRSDLPNDMWRERSVGQLEKCAEAGALRKAFPEELGSEYAAEEMEGRRKFVDLAEAVRATTPPPNWTPPATPGVKAQQAATIAEAHAAAAAEPKIVGPKEETVSMGPPLDLDMGEDEPQQAQIPLDGDIMPPQAKKQRTILEIAEEAFGKVKNLNDLEIAFNDTVGPQLDPSDKDTCAEVYVILERHENRIKEGK